MSGYNSKRKLSENTTDDGLSSAKIPKTEEAPVGRSSRARKKTAKVLEMEAFEEEIASSTGKGSKSKKKPLPIKVQEIDEGIDLDPIQSLKKSPKTPPTSRKKSAKTPPVIIVEDTSPGLPDIKKEEDSEPLPKDASALKMILTLPVKHENSNVDLPDDIMASHSEGEMEPVVKVEAKPKKKVNKKTKTKANVENIPTSTKSKQKSPKVEVKEEISSPVINSISGITTPDDFPHDDAPLIVAEKVAKKKKSASKKKVKKPEPTGFQPALLNFESEISSKMEVLDYSDFVDTVTGMKEEEVDLEVDEGEPIQPTVKKKTPSKASAKKKPASTVEKGKARRKGKGKKPALQKPDKAPKRRTTAYTLWCNNMRKELMLQYPDIDFAHISRKLAELWQTVSVAEKNTLRKRAKKIQKKQNLGKDVSMNNLPVSKHMRSGQPQQIERSKPVVYSQQSPQQSPSYNYKITGNAPIDVAAHLKLLGESLGTIGARLQEHRGQIAVQGSLSVLLDSMLCALGPLMCLTNQVPELNSVPTHIHKRTLDNIAYIMPGIG